MLLAAAQEPAAASTPVYWRERLTALKAGLEA